MKTTELLSALAERLLKNYERTYPVKFTEETREQVLRRVLETVTNACEVFGWDAKYITWWMKRRNDGVERLRPIEVCAIGYALKPNQDRVALFCDDSIKSPFQNT